MVRKLHITRILSVNIMVVDKFFLLFWLSCCVIPCVFLYLHCFDGLMLKLK